MQQPLSFVEGYFESFLRTPDKPGAPAVVQPWQLLKNAEDLDAFCRQRFAFGAGGPLLASPMAESR